jgi:Fe-S cluster assembly protein SufD
VPSGPPARGSSTPSAFTSDAVAALPGPGWLSDARLAAFERFGSMTLPAESEEVWRYSRIDDLQLDSYAPGGPGEAGGSVARSAHHLLDALGTRAGLLVLRDGHPVHADLAPETAAMGVELGWLSEAADGAEHLGAVAGSPDALVGLAGAFLPDAAFVRVPARVSVSAPLVVVHFVTTDGQAVFPRTVVTMGEGAQAGVVEVLMSPDVAALVVPVVELDVGDDAELGYVGVQELGPRVWQVAYQASRVGRYGHLRSFSMGLGGHYARLRTDSRLAGHGGSSDLMAAYFGGGDQMHDFRTMQDHDAPKTTSDLLFKGAVAGEARSVYSGLIRVRRGAVGTNAFQTNRNLVLSEGAHADSVPNLDIAENDVRCSHASAVGPIDEDQRYYLESRGIPPEVADRLIVLGFFDDIVARAPVPGLAGYLRESVAAKLPAGPLSAPSQPSGTAASQRSA